MARPKFIMRKSVTESTVLFLSIIKWIFLATIAGVIVGGAVSLFLKALTWSIGITAQHANFFWFLPVSLFLSSLMIKYLAPDAEGHGTEKVIEAVHKRAGKIPILVIPVKAVATLFTLALGGSVGKEGPCAQIGAGLTSLYSDIFRFDDHDRKKMVICGISAGFASVFGAPIAGSIFGVEVLFVGAIMYDVLLPSFIAGITSYQISSALGVSRAASISGSFFSTPPGPPGRISGGAYRAPLSASRGAPKDGTPPRGRFSAPIFPPTPPAEGKPPAPPPVEPVRPTGRGMLLPPPSSATPVAVLPTFCGAAKALGGSGEIAVAGDARKPVPLPAKRPFVPGWCQ
ncbi:MAG: chloride channel protein [Candidatus Kryptoniota bacterium]